MVLVRDAESAVNRALLRAEGYRLLAVAFAHPEPEQLREELAAAPGALDAIRAPLLAHVDDRMAGEHTRLFSQTTPVSPNEGHYFASDKGVLMGQLAALYELFGARIGGGERESPDHIGVELEFAALLSLKEALAQGAEELEVAQAARRVFMQEHLGRWTDELGARLESASGHPFYAALGRALADWVAADLGESGFVVERRAGRALPMVQVDGDELTCASAG
jgi:putative dimethyl sulfoxide reductase chaperone